jgi:site-specific recombinase XerD
MREILPSLTLEPAPSADTASKLTPTLNQKLESWIAGGLSPHTRRAYRQDAHQFLQWLTARDLALEELTLEELEQYRLYLVEHFAKNSASRKFNVVRKLLSEATNRKIIGANPAQGIKGIKIEDETTHRTLQTDEAVALLRTVDTSTRQGKRDYAIVFLLIRTGLRRSECATLRLGDLRQEQGHHIAMVMHGKGDKRRKIKIPVDVMRAIWDYLEATNRKELEPDEPLFIQFRKGDHPQKAAISDQVIERVVSEHAQKLGLKLSPHGLRATFVTMALDGGARLHQVQYAVGHADPRTTERYQTRKFNLDSNAVDFVHIALPFNS